MSGVLANIGHFRQKVKTSRYKKLLKKKKKNTKHKSTRWLTLPSGPALLCWLLLTFSKLSLACSLPSVRDRSNIILGVPRSNHKEQGKFKNNIIK